ncbi:calcium-translocating p-type pmca-type : Calcium-translocating P-type ATPase, PMCA-type OS=Methanospirillum hungatei JF-1 (strain ATCC 27890 / DSM 864 / NBRC 100397 / JF-1) GN=Mhun_0342 PE=4 SV=1: Cation_ATPase_N: E1-E2_ATPase: Hydrolase: Cation_ATPase_C [Gemmata massiliana]|uniref:P-type Ca(2+) transporter n=1 Tax=Gemmata massiliana TaxID=1210884 RepID=A0A6P2D513_9BACT|nr:calcium-translocating P-type ATPase, PMCA-type [Gemmata massiliana]VTR95576.1 calcium-translocating p-type pmca-type : Calcium-translocating P-type ATPase, PMCA-type OS=Methanospirillum hungatei JF-1 (strain ATCC 27890 / DSM 864 / NBRC 100397 / JF-1) GN=Mhun_0342 PE=4 SV=1: Cation_ATPase_N: E1-E2_ATPase: Hydrolase: Cation_ATPase_C [Gemmata massiliana]
MRSLRAISDIFPHATESGLTTGQVAESRAKFGANRLTPLPREPVWKKFLEKFADPIIKILLAASLLKIVVDLFETSPLAGGLALGMVLVVVLGALAAKFGEWLPAILFALAGGLVGVSAALDDPSYEGLAVMVAVFLATGVAFFSEFRSDREFEKLNATRDAIRVKVLRDGGVHALALEDAVVGDLVLLEMGDEIPADGRIVRSNELHVDQALMTGESEPAKKTARISGDDSDGPDQPDCVFRGTQVRDGVGQMVVTNIGDDTMLGQIAQRLSGASPTPDTSDATPEDRSERVQQKLTISKASTPLQEKLEALAGLISKIGYAAAIAIFIALLVRGLIQGEVRLPQEGEDASKVLLGSVRALLSYFVYMVIVIVVAVPEGLPMSVTVSLAIAWRKMSQANSLVRQLVACETIGSATVICSDKTGTLTQNKMTVSRVGLGTTVYEQEGTVSPGAKHDESVAHSPLFWVIVNSAANSTASLEEKNGKTTVVGNSTEGALLNWLAGGAWSRADGLSYIELRTQYPVLYQIHFSSDRKRMTTVVKNADSAVTLVKGAPEVLLTQCDKYRAADGSTRALTPDIRTEIQAHISTAAGDAMRTLAFAHAELPADFPREESAIHDRRAAIENGLIFDGWVGIRDPLRDDVKEAIRQCRTAGIEVKMITGDTIETATAIGREIGLLDEPDALALTHADFAKLTDAELSAILPRLRVLARALPGDKFRIVELLQAQNHVVAMTGDGTNDAPALKKADVGLAMGISGTEVAKEASKIVLLDDAFSTIVRGVHWGRALYENIQRFIQFQLTINVSALLIAFLGPFLGLKPPFTVLQLLWINVIMDTFAAIALCSEPPRANLMHRPPKTRNESILTPAMLGTIASTAMFFVVVMIAFLLGMQHADWFAGGGPKSDEFPELTLRQVTLFFTVYVFFQVWNQINCRSLAPEESGWHRLFENRQFLAIASLTVVGQVLIVSFGGAVFNVEPLRAVDWLVVAAATSSVLLFAEVARRVRLWTTMKKA